MQTYVIAKCNNSFERTKEFSLKMAQQAPKYVAEKVIINILFYLICEFCWCVKDNLYKKKARNGNPQDILRHFPGYFSFQAKYEKTCLTVTIYCDKIQIYS